MGFRQTAVRTPVLSVAQARQHGTFGISLTRTLVLSLDTDRGVPYSPVDVFNFLVEATMTYAVSPQPIPSSSRSCHLTH